MGERLRKILVGLATGSVLAAILAVQGGGLGVTDAGSYRFLQTQPDDPNAPLTYSSCEPIRVEINTDGIDDEATAKQIVLSAMGEISAASHLQLVYAGPTDRRPRYPDTTVTVLGGAPPVLVSFATSREVPRLAGSVSGIGGSTAFTFRGLSTYVTGQATLDADYVNDTLQRRGGWERVRATAMHELGHVIGLDHAPGGREVMNSSSSGRNELGPGDRRGLALLGKGPCA